MKKIIFALCLSLGFNTFATAKDYKYETVDGDLMKSRIYTLDNGLKVYLSVNKEQPRVQAYIAVKTGSRNDPAETTGLAHYLEHLMFKGTKILGTSDYSKEKVLLDDIANRYEQYRKLTDEKKRKEAYHAIDSVSQLASKYFIPNEYDKLMAAIGSQGSNAFTSNDVTCYEEDIPSNEIDNWLNIQSDRFQNMVIRGFHTELEAVYEEKNISLGSDMDKEFTAFNALLYPSHPYGTQTTLGTQEHLKNPSILNIEKYFHNYYVPNNVAICMSGDINPNEVIATIDKYFGNWKRNNNLVRPSFAPQPELAAVADTTVYGLESENIIMGWRFNGTADMQNDTLMVLTNILSNGEAGLMDIDMVQKMKVLSMNVFCDNMTDYSSLMVMARPTDNQTLKDVQQLVMSEIDKLKRGDFADNLLHSVVNNLKLDFYKTLRNNKYRASLFVSSFINNIDWKDQVTQIDRLSKLKKQDIIDFANKHLNDNYVCVYKAIGEDSTIKKIDKPQITPIATNRDLSSDYLKEITQKEAAPIAPQFVDFKKDMSVGKTKKGIPLLYKKNTDDGMFDLTFYYDFGTEDMKGIDEAVGYLDYIGTKKKSSEDIKKAFYELACSYDISVNTSSLEVNLSGLNENMPQALQLLEDVLQNASADKESYDGYVDLILKSREDIKSNQRACYAYLREYGMYGEYNLMRNKLSENELKTESPQKMTDKIKQLLSLKHTIMYYGPYSEEQLQKTIAKYHHTSKTLNDVPQGKEYTLLPTKANEVVIAPYEAKNIYMMQYFNEEKQWSAEEAPVKALFNQYFGGGMNTVVFQELRESRGLAYSAMAYYNEAKRKNHNDYFNTFIISQNDKMMDCINVFNSIIDTIPQGQSAFDIAKQGLTKSLQSSRTTRFDVLAAYIAAQKLGIDYDINKTIYEALPSLTMQDMVTFEKKNVANKPFKYIILGDEKQLDMKALNKIAPVKRVSIEEIFGY